MFRLKQCIRFCSIWLVGAGLLSVLWWWLGRAVIIDAPPVSTGRALECVSYTPYEKDQSPWNFAGDVIACPQTTESASGTSLSGGGEIVGHDRPRPRGLAQLHRAQGNEAQRLFMLAQPE